MTLFAIFLVFLAVNRVEHNGSTAQQANRACAQHEGIKELVAPGREGAYALCNDGFAVRTKDPNDMVWRDDILWPWEWL